MRGARELFALFAVFVRTNRSQSGRAALARVAG